MADVVAGGVANDGRRNQRQQQHRVIEVAARREQARRDQQRIPGQKEPDEQSGLGKDDDDQPVEADDPDKFGDVVDVREELVNEVHQRWSSAWARSSRRSLTSSMPTEMRTRSSVTPISRRRSAGTD